MIPAEGGLGERLRHIATSVADQVGLHGELFWIEWQAERSRVMRFLITWLVTLLFASFALIFASISAILAAWDTPYRLHVALALFLLYGIGFAICRRHLKAIGETDSSFAKTREQLSESAAFLKTLL